MNDREQYNAARKLFEDFHERAPDIKRSELVWVGGLLVPTIALEVGTLLSVGYKSVGDGVAYHHEFSRLNRPRLYSNASADQLYILGGGYRFSERGILK
jgi:hypothetical protein